MAIDIILWILLLAPFASAAFITIFLQKNRQLSSLVSVGAAVLGFILALVVIVSPDPSYSVKMPWIVVGEFTVSIGLQVDALSKLMLFVVTFIGMLVHIYSMGYMKEDDGRSRYFAGLSMFMFSMLGIVLSDNFVMMFIFWELVGVSSYILIGHWFKREQAADAAKKAFLVNRIGDFGFMIGILMVFSATGAIGFAEIQGALQPGKVDYFYAQIAALFIFCGAIGKSAQLPLHVWLPDAMEGPTPVSALIHAATMVAAGVFMLVRVSFLVNWGEMDGLNIAQTTIAWIGTITAFMAGLMAVQQNDIKRILAYSTLSQLGYMIAAVGMAAGPAAMFHLFTHAFFKALLFLGAGSVILGMHHEQDIWKMGAVKNKMPVTWITFTLGALALCAIPFFTSGGWSKELILEAAYEKDQTLFWILAFTAFLTAFYMARLYIVTFFGKPRSEEAKHAHESPGVMIIPLVVLAVPSIIAGFAPKVHLFFTGEMLNLHANHGEHAAHESGLLVLGVSVITIVVGFALAFVLYRNKDRDPLNMPLLANKFYFDEVYDGIVRYTQDRWAGVLSWIDRWVLDGVCVSGFSKVTWGIGYLVRFFQSGNLQGYSFLFGLGVVLLLYFSLFAH